MSESASILNNSESESLSDDNSDTSNSDAIVTFVSKKPVVSRDVDAKPETVTRTTRQFIITASDYRLLFIEGDEKETKSICEKHMNGEDVDGVILTGKDVDTAKSEKLESVSGSSFYGVIITLTDGGKQKLKDATSQSKNAKTTISVWLDGEYVSSFTLSGSFSRGEITVPEKDKKSADDLARRLSINGRGKSKTIYRKTTTESE
jgi:hypothetical protein